MANAPPSSMDRYLRGSRAEAESASHLFRGEAELGDHDDGRGVTHREPGDTALHLLGTRVALLGFFCPASTRGGVTGAARSGKRARCT